MRKTVKILVALAVVFCVSDAFAQIAPPSSLTVAQRSGGRRPIDAAPPVDEDGEPEDVSTPIGEIKNVAEALKALNGAIHNQGDLFARLNEQIEALSKISEENWKAVSERVANIESKTSVSPKEFNDAIESVKKELENVRTMSLTPEGCKALLEGVEKKQTENFNNIETKINEQKIDAEALAEAVKQDPPKKTNVDWASQVSAWLAAIYACARTLVLSVGWFKKRAKNAQELQQKLAAFQSAQQTTQQNFANQNNANLL